MKINETELPKEVIELVKMAMSLNISKDNFRSFLKEAEERRKNN